MNRDELRGRVGAAHEQYSQRWTRAKAALEAVLAALDELGTLGHHFQLEPLALASPAEYPKALAHPQPGKEPLIVHAEPEELAALQAGWLAHEPKPYVPPAEPDSPQPEPDPALAPGELSSDQSKPGLVELPPSAAETIAVNQTGGAP